MNISDRTYQELSDLLADWALENVEHIIDPGIADNFGHHMALHARELFGENVDEQEGV